MKNLNLNAYGVVEMSGAEMREVNAGNVAEFFGRVVGYLHNAIEWLGQYIDPQHPIILR
jgi:hypothetical protein